MPSGAKRRKAAKKKKEKKTSIANGNGEVKVIESDGGENSSRASQDLDAQQNPFSKDEDKKPSLRSESVENESDGRVEMSKGDGDVVVEIVGEAKSGNDGISEKVDGDDDWSLKGSTSGSLSGESVDDGDDDYGSQVVDVEFQKAEKEGSQVDTDQESFAKETSHVKDATTHVTQVVEFESNADALDKVVHEPESMPVEKSVGYAAAEMKSRKSKEKVHPSETSSDLKVENLPVSNTNFGETSRETFDKQLPQPNIYIGNGERHAGSSLIQHSAENEPLLHPARGPVNKTSWTGCCGLLELFTGSS